MAGHEARLLSIQENALFHPFSHVFMVKITNFELFFPEAAFGQGYHQFPTSTFCALSNDDNMKYVTFQFRLPGVLENIAFFHNFPNV